MKGDLSQLLDTAAGQHGLVTSNDIEAAGLAECWVSRRATSGMWQRVHRGVYATSPGTLTWEQRARAALLYGGPRAVLSHRSAGYLHRLLAEPPDSIEILVPYSVVLRAAPEVAIHRTRRSLGAVQPSRPGEHFRGLRCREIVETVLDMVDVAATDREVLSLVIAAFQQRISHRLLAGRAGRRHDLHHRSHLLRIIAETPDGVESELERRYHDVVERAHGLPTAVRQRREKVRGRWIRSDCSYEGFGLLVELDGEFAHPGRATSADVTRDNDSLVSRDERTLRFRWPHTYVPEACVAAAQVGGGLRRGGWTGAPRPCGPGCTVMEGFRLLTR